MQLRPEETTCTSQNPHPGPTPALSHPMGEGDGLISRGSFPWTAVVSSVGDLPEGFNRATERKMVHPRPSDGERAGVRVPEFCITGFLNKVPN
jgi:hypothetical protein